MHLLPINNNAGVAALPDPVQCHKAAGMPQIALTRILELPCIALGNLVAEKDSTKVRRYYRMQTHASGLNVTSKFTEGGQYRNIELHHGDRKMTLWRISTNACLGRAANPQNRVRPERVLSV